MEQEFYKGDRVLYRVHLDKYWLVEVTQVKRAYGKIRYVIKPAGSVGDEITVEGHNLTVTKK